MATDTPRPADRRPLRVLWRVISKSWADSILGMSAQAAFWATLSLPPLLLGLLGSLGYVGGWFGADIPAMVQSKIITFSRSVFSPPVVEQIIVPTVADVLREGRGGIVSLGFLLSLWAGSTAISSFVDSIITAHGQQNQRHPVWQQIFALLLYAAALLVAVFTLPLVALGPQVLTALFPPSMQDDAAALIDAFYYPVVAGLLVVALTTLYKVALPRSLPWHRLIAGALLAGAFFVTASAVLRAYLTWVTSTGYTYGALAAPIAYLLFTFFLGFSIVLGAELNAVVQELWPARATRLDLARDRLVTAGRNTARLNTARLNTGRLALGRPPSARLHPLGPGDGNGRRAWTPPSPAQSSEPGRSPS